MLYFDTAYIIKCYSNEPGSLELAEFLEENSGLGSSAFAKLEFACALHRNLREKHLRPEEATTYLAEFRRDEKAGLWTFFPVTTDLLEIASDLIAKLSPRIFLRAGDALHLVTAKEHGFAEIYTNDSHMLAAAAHFGLRAVNVIGL